MIGGISYNYYSYYRFAHANTYSQAVQASQQAERSTTAPSQPGPKTPVEPVSPVSPRYAEPAEETSNGIPFLRQGVDPVEMAVRMRIQYVDEENKEQVEQSSETSLEDVECKTCESRKYQDGSDDPGVSFKSPTHISPEEASMAVQGHEQEHVVRERDAAEKEGREVVSQSVRLHTDICPECGKVYISGGVTTTTTAAKDEPEQAVENAANMGFFAVA